jgi:hypothetical protein
MGRRREGMREKGSGGVSGSERELKSERESERESESESERRRPEN